MGRKVGENDGEMKGEGKGGRELAVMGTGKRNIVFLICF